MICDNNNEDKNYHLHFDKTLKAGCAAVGSLTSLTSTAKSSQQSEKKEMFPSFLDDDLYFTDTILIELNSIDADLKRPDDITNLFVFDK
jgi:hypothetical protein